MVAVKTSLLLIICHFGGLFICRIISQRHFVDVLSVMEPLASVAQLRLNMKPERDNFTIPKIVADVVFEEIVIAFGKNQVCGFWPLCVYAALVFMIFIYCSNS